MKAVAVMIHVPDIRAALEWYRRAFSASPVSFSAEEGLAVLDVGGFTLEIVRADAKVSSGKCGTVLYWQVAELDAAVSELVAMGARLYRGPMRIDDRLGMCQLEDPFGNLIGLRGKMSMR